MKEILIITTVIVVTAVIALLLVMQKTPDVQVETETNDLMTPPAAVKSDDIVADITQAFAEKYSKPLDVIMLTVEQAEGSFAKGTIRFADEVGGAVWFGVSEGDR